jgi:hypothetical protein
MVPPLRVVDRGGGDRKLNLLFQVLICQRRSAAALHPIGVKWCQNLEFHWLARLSVVREVTK